MLICTIISYTLLSLFFFLDPFLRKGSKAKNHKQNKYDHWSSLLILIAFVFVLVCSIVLNLLQVGQFNNKAIAAAGVVLMFIGFMVRIFSMLSLDKYYTRTLIVDANQEIIQHGIYKFVRHPGYLGTLLIWGCCGISMHNWLVEIIAIALLLIAYYYRIIIEEKMLLEKYSNAYASYMTKTWRLIPFIW